MPYGIIALEDILDDTYHGLLSYKKTNYPRSLIYKFMTASSTKLLNAIGINELINKVVLKI